MRINILLVVGGMILAGTGIYRAAPIKLTAGIWLNNGPILGLLLVFIIWVASLGSESLLRGIQGTFVISSQYLPMILALFPVMAFGAVVAGHYQMQVTKMMAGPLGYPGTMAAAFLTPGGNTVAKFIETLWQTRALRPQLLFFLTCTPLVSWQIYLIRQMGLGPEIAWAMYRTNWLLAGVLLPIFWLWSWWVKP